MDLEEGFEREESRGLADGFGKGVSWVEGAAWTSSVGEADIGRLEDGCGGDML